MGMTLRELAQSLGLDLRGRPDLVVDRVAELAKAGPGSLAFLADAKYLGDLKETGATAVILKAAQVAGLPGGGPGCPGPTPGLCTGRPAPASADPGHRWPPSQRRGGRRRPGRPERLDRGPGGGRGGRRDRSAGLRWSGLYHRRRVPDRRGQPAGGAGDPVRGVRGGASGAAAPGLRHRARGLRFRPGRRALGAGAATGACGPRRRRGRRGQQRRGPRGPGGHGDRRRGQDRQPDSDRP